MRSRSPATPEGRPAIRLHGLAARLADEAGGVTIQVSLTHSATSAGAVAVVSTAGVAVEQRDSGAARSVRYLPKHLPHPSASTSGVNGFCTKALGGPRPRSVISSSV